MSDSMLELSLEGAGPDFCGQFLSPGAVEMNHQGGMPQLVEHWCGEKCKVRRNDVRAARFERLANHAASLPEPRRQRVLERRERNDVSLTAASHFLGADDGAMDAHSLPAQMGGKIVVDAIEPARKFGKPAHPDLKG